MIRIRARLDWVKHDVSLGPLPVRHYLYFLVLTQVDELTRSYMSINMREQLEISVAVVFYFAHFPSARSFRAAMCATMRLDLGFKLS